MNWKSKIILKANTGQLTVITQNGSVFWQTSIFIWKVANEWHFGVKSMKAHYWLCL